MTRPRVYTSNAEKQRAYRSRKVSALRNTDGVLRNKVVCSDALEFLKGLPDQSVDAIITDPPYGTTACAWDTVVPFAPMWEGFKRVIKPRGAIVMTASQPFTSALVMSNPSMFRYEWIWVKDNGTDFLNVNRKPFEAHENIVVFYKAQPTYNPQMKVGTPYRLLRGTAYRSGLQQPDVADGTKTINLGQRYPRSYQYFETARGLHPTQKPVSLWSYLIRTYTQPGELVLDPFCGSGTTAVACRATGRDFLCCDLSPEYVAMSLRRLAQSDPLLDREIGNGLVQRSLFSSEDAAP